MSERIYSPSPGSIVQYKSDNGKLFDVYIVSGKWMVNERLSNWWNFRRVLSNGKLGKLQSNYGNFYETLNKYNIEIKINKL